MNRMTQSPASLTHSEHEPIAIVGMGLVFPGADTSAEFWSLVESGRCMARTIPEERWPVSPKRLFDPSEIRPDAVYGLSACLVDSHWRPDAKGVDWPSGIDASTLDPVFGMAIHAAASAWNGSRTASIDRSRVSVILGNIALPTESTANWSQELFSWEMAKRRGMPRPLREPNSWNRDPVALPAKLVSSALRLGGRSFTLDAACASSLYAFRLAMDELRKNEADAVLAGGLSRPDCLYTQMGFAQLHALSRAGVPRPFDDRGDGLVVGEGAGVFLLKRISDAIDQGDRILGVLRAVGLSNDISGALLAPSSEGQLRAMRAAYDEAGLTPDAIDAIECHATGTPVGDTEEFRSLNRLWAGFSHHADGCVLGSVKSNIGHGLTSAGAAGLAKLLLAFENQTYPPTAGFEVPRQGMSLTGKPFRVLREAEPWPTRDKHTPRRAALSGFGFGGINAHLIVEEFLPGSNSLRSINRDRLRSVQLPAKVAVAGFGGRFGDHEGVVPLTRSLVAGLLGMPGQPGHWFGVTGPGGISDGSAVDAEVKSLSVERVEVPIGRFRIPPSELSEILPQQAMILNAAHEAAIESGWLEESSGPRLRTAVLLGVSLDQATNHFQLRWSLTDPRSGEHGPSGDLIESRDALGPPLTANRVMGNLASIAASRLAREFRLGGPSFTVSEGPNAGLTALEIAYGWIVDGLIDEALVGAVDLTSDVRHAWAEWLESREAENRAESGRIILCDSAIALILKRADKIAETASSAYLTLEQVSERKLDGCPTYPWSIVDDSLLAGASSGLSEWARHYLSLTRKLEPASGIRLSETDSTPLLPARYWFPVSHRQPRETVVPASINGRVHRIVENLQNSKRVDDFPISGDPVGVFLIDANSQAELSGKLERLKRQLVVDSQNDLTPAESADHWWSENESEEPIAGERLALVLQKTTDGAALLEEAAYRVKNGISLNPGRLPNRSEFYYLPVSDRSGDMAFVFPGMGNAYSGMGRELSLRWPSMFDKVSRKWSNPRESFLGGLFWDRELPSDPEDHLDFVFGPVGFGMAVSDFVRGIGVEPDAMIGLSLGESVSLLASGAWRDCDELWQRMRKSPLFRKELAGECLAARRCWGLADEESVDWLTMVVPKPIETVRAALAGETRVSLLIINSPNEVVIGGRGQDVLRVLERMKCRKLPVGIVSTMHAPLANSVRTEYLALHTLPVHDPWPLRLYSAHFGDSYRPTTQTAAEAITGLSHKTVDFAGLVEKAYADGVRTFVEIGPGSSCTRMIQNILKDRSNRTLALTPSKGDPVIAFLKGMAYLYALGRGQSRYEWSKAFGWTRPKPKSKSVTLRVGGPPIDWPTDMDLPSPKPLMLEWRNLSSMHESNPEVLSADSASAGAAVSSEADSAKANSVSDHLETRIRSIPEEVVREEVIMPPRSSIDLIEESAVTMSEMIKSTHDRNESEMQMRESMAIAVINSQNASAEAHAQFQVLWSELLGDFRSLALGSDFSIADNGADSPFSEMFRFQPSASSEPMTLTDAHGSRTYSPEIPARMAIPEEPPRSLSRELCLTYGRGPIAPVFGRRFQEIDSYPTRVRLPDEPLMLVDRVTAIEGEPLSLTHGRIVTEHDVLPDDWYLDCGRVPVCIAVESGQADLMLSGFLGIDLETKGLAVYRLLDATVTFHDRLPKAGDVIVYDIRILNFFRQDRSRLFRFAFEATVDGKPLMTMLDGCAGFFTPETLAAGQGIVRTTNELKPRPGKRPDDWKVLAPMSPTSISVEALDALRKGDLAAAFGPEFASLPLKNPVTLPAGRMRLVDRITELEPSGGRFGLGLIRGEFDIRPEAWFMVCHFVDDRVMPGTLMYECCLHTLRIFLMRMGWVCDQGPDVAMEPIPGVRSRLRCRGQVLESTKTVTYEIEIKELGYGPEPYCIADALMYADGKPIVDMRDMSLKYSGVTREMVESLWAGHSSQKRGDSRGDDERAAPGIPFAGGFAPGESIKGHLRPTKYTHSQILEFAEGSPSLCFGAPYRVFDHERRLARLPRPPFNFLHRISEVTGEPFVMKSGGTAVGEFDVHPDDWYFAQERTGRMPFTVLQEAALQVCGWLSSYVGSALTSSNDLAYRNLGGSCRWHKPILAGAETLTTTAKLTSLSQSAGMIIQHFRMDMVDRGGNPVYSGTTYFGFFDREALKNQIGIRGFEPWSPSADELRNALPAQDYPKTPPLPGETLRMIDRIVRWLPDGGPNGLGHVVGETVVKPDSWFFDAHFYQDPVVPGSLGLESFIQLMKAQAVRRWGGKRNGHSVGIPAGTDHEWEYRGQVIPADKVMTTVMNVSAVDDRTQTLWADGHLEVDGRYIYRMKKFAVRLE